MSPIDPHERWMKDKAYRRAHFEAEPSLRLAIHVIRFRNEAGLTQEELAERMAKKQSWISRVEAGRENVTLKSLGQFAYAFGKDPSDFLAAVDLEPSDDPPPPRFVWVTHGAQMPPKAESSRRRRGPQD